MDSLRPPSNVFPSYIKTHKTQHQQTPAPEPSCVRGKAGRKGDAPRKAQDGVLPEKSTAVGLWKTQTLVGTQQGQSVVTVSWICPKLAGQNGRNWPVLPGKPGFLFSVCSSSLQYGTTFSRRHFGWHWDQMTPTEKPSLWQRPYAQTAKHNTPSSETGKIRMAEGASTFRNRLSPSLMEI